MLIKGDKIKMVATIPQFNRVGEIFKIIDISETGVITFQASYGRGIMSYDECEKYFEKIEDKPLIWGEWQDVSDIEFGTYRTNGKTIEMVDEMYGKIKKVKTTCLDGDVFDLEKGLELCKAKIRVLRAKSSINESIKLHRMAVKELNKKLREM